MSRAPTAADWERVAICAAAAEDDADALQTVMGRPELAERATSLRLGPALALAAERLGVSAPEAWRSQLRASMAGWLLVDRAAKSVAGALSSSRQPWAPIKGFDIGTRFYSQRERRSTSDLDVLVSSEGFPEVRRALESEGWRGLAQGKRSERYLRQEGYAWQAIDSAGTLLEVHFRLWGLVPTGLELEALAASKPDSRLGESGRRLGSAHAFVLAAIHGWTQASPRSLNDWVDLHQIEARVGENLVIAVTEISRRWSMELPVALSVMVADRLWPSPTFGDMLERLRPRLRRREAGLLSDLVGGGIESVSWRNIALARLVSGRPSRAGWRTVWRQVWAHPGTVERATPSEWSWPRRRLHHLLASMGRS